jgi:hypothetical protein
MGRIWMAMTGVCLGGMAVAAQAPTSTMSRDVISAIGCVQPAAADGLAPETGEGIGPGFVLTKARVAPSLGTVESSRRSSPGTPSSNEGSQATNSAEPGSGAPPLEARASGADLATRRDAGLILVADRGIELAQHVGRRVMVTGRLSSFAAPGGVPSPSSGQTLTVTKLSVIAPACTTSS